MAVLAVQKPAMSGQALTYVAVTASDSFANVGKEILYIENSSVDPVTVTVTSVINCNHGFNHPLVVAVEAGAEKMIGPFVANRFNDSTGKVTFACTPLVGVAAAIVSHS